MCMCRHFLNEYGVLDVFGHVWCCVVYLMCGHVLLLLLFKMAKRYTAQWTLIVIQEIQKCQRKSYYEGTETD